MILKRVFLYTFVLTFTVLVAGFASGVSAYNCKPGDTVCENETEDVLGFFRKEMNLCFGRVYVRVNIHF